MTAVESSSRPPREDVGRSARSVAIEARDGGPSFMDIGLGNNPTLSPDDKWIAFLLHPSAERGPNGRVADARRRLTAASRGRVRSPLLVSGRPQFPDPQLLSPHRVHHHQSRDQGGRRHRGRGTSDLLLAELGRPRYGGVGPRPEGEVRRRLDRPPRRAQAGRGEDHRRPLEAGRRFDVNPLAGLRPETGQCFFTGNAPKKRAIYSVRRGESLRARPAGVVVETVPIPGSRVSRSRRTADISSSTPTGRAESRPGNVTRADREEASQFRHSARRPEGENWPETQSHAATRL